MDAADPTCPSAQAHGTPSTEAVPLQGLRTQALQSSSWCWQELSKNLCSFPSRHLSEFAILHVNRDKLFYPVYILCLFPFLHSAPKENPGLSPGHTPFSSISESAWGAGCEAGARGTERNAGRAGQGCSGEAGGGEAAESWACEAKAGEMQDSTLPGQKGAPLWSDLTVSQIKPNLDCCRSQTEQSTGTVALPACQHVTCGQEDVHQKETRMKGRGMVKSWF